MPTVKPSIVALGFFTIGFVVWWMMGRPGMRYKAPSPPPPPDAPVAATEPVFADRRWRIVEPAINDMTYRDDVPGIGMIITR